MPTFSAATSVPRNATVVDRAVAADELDELGRVFFAVVRVRVELCPQWPQLSVTWTRPPWS